LLKEVTKALIPAQDMTDFPTSNIADALAWVKNCNNATLENMNKLLERNNLSTTTKTTKDGKLKQLILQLQEINNA